MMPRNDLGGHIIFRTVNRSPTWTPDFAISPVPSSMTANPPNAKAMRDFGSATRVFTTTPSRLANTMSIGKRIPNVCTALLGAMTSAVPGGNPSRPRRPRFRLAESNAPSRRLATGRSRPSATRAHSSSERLRAAGAAEENVGGRSQRAQFTVRIVMKAFRTKADRGKGCPCSPFGSRRFLEPFSSSWSSRSSENRSCLGLAAPPRSGARASCSSRLASCSDTPTRMHSGALRQ